MVAVAVILKIVSKENRIGVGEMVIILRNLRVLLAKQAQRKDVVSNATCY